MVFVIKYDIELKDQKSVQRIENSKLKNKPIAKPKISQFHNIRLPISKLKMILLASDLKSEG